MEGVHSLMIAASALGFAGAALGVRYALAGGRRASLGRDEAGARTGMAWRLAVHGVSGLRGAAQRLLAWPRVGSFAQKAVLVLAGQGVAATELGLATSALAGAGVAFALGLLASGSWVGAVAVSCLAVAGAVAWVNHRADAQADAMRECVPEALRAMQTCFQSGYSLMQTLAQVADETKGSLSQLFLRASQVLQAGGTSTAALECLRKADDLPELAFVSVALDVQHQTGGSMRRCLDSAIDMVQAQLDLQRSLRVQTAQARLSARIVGVMPFVLIALFSVISEGFLDPFFESLTGMVLLAVALAMQAAGVLLVRSLLKVG